MAREVVLDANVIVARLDEADALFQRADLLSQELRAEGAEPVCLLADSRCLSASQTVRVEAIAETRDLPIVDVVGHCFEVFDNGGHLHEQFVQA